MELTLFHEFPPPHVVDRWRECLQHGDFPTHYTSPEYFREPPEAGQSRVAALVWESGDVVGILTGIQTDRELTCGLASRPQICLRRGRDNAATMQALADWLLADNRSASLITLYTWTRTEPFARRGFGCVQADAVVVLDLTRGPEALLKDFSANRRINVKKAIRAGVEVVQTSDEDDFARYYEIHRGWCQHKGVKVQPFEQVLALLRLTDNRRLFLARVDGRPIAGIVVRFVPGGLVEYAACGWYKDALELRPNDLLHWRAIEWACASGYRAYSLAGSHLFLRKFGGEVKPTYRYRIDRTFLRRHEVNAAAVAHVRAVFHRLPSLVQMSVRRLLPKAVVMDGLTSLLAG